MNRFRSMLAFPLGLAALLVLAPACRNAETANGTAVFVTIAFPLVPAVDQLRLTAQNATGTLFAPKYRPTQAAAPLTSPQSLHLLLKDTDIGQVDLVVEGLHQGQVVALGNQRVVVRLGHETSVDVTLAPGQSCTCPGDNGCCNGTACVTVPSKAQCGQQGTTCFACDLRADGCDASGQCVCGTSGSACAEGQQCVKGQCACTPESCASGCCRSPGVGGVCDTSQASASCGLAGLACDNCGAGACDQGRCSNNLSCNASCLGCCSGATCVTPSSLNACGANGGGCQVCDPVRADSCDVSGNCTCGKNPACPAGQSCVPGSGHRGVCQ